MLQQKGWMNFTLNNNHKLLNALIAKKKAWLEESIAFFTEKSNVNLSTFSEESASAIELVKGPVRAFLRYDSDAISLSREVHKKLREEVPQNHQLKHVTLPYAIIHWPGDHSEKGPMHKDGYYYIKRFYTNWVPLNDTHHDGIAVMENSHYVQHPIARRLRLPAFLPATQIIKPKMDTGQFLSWHGAVDHEGLINTTQEITVALVVRFTDTPIMLDATQRVAELDKWQPQEGGMNFTEFLRIANSLFDSITLQNNMDVSASSSWMPAFEQIEDRVKKLNLSDIDRHKMAVVLTLWAQRMQEKTNVLVFFLYAIALSNQAIYAVQQVLRYCLKHGPDKHAQEMMVYILKLHPYRQHGFVIEEQMHSANRTGSRIFVDVPANLPLLVV